MGSWSEWRDQAAGEAALKAARGVYQRNLIRGVESLSGSTLRGSAKDWSRRYAASRAAVLGRIRAAGIAVSERIGDRGRRILVIG